MSIKLSPWGICLPWELCGTLAVKSPHPALLKDSVFLRSMYQFHKKILFFFLKNYIIDVNFFNYFFTMSWSELILLLRSAFCKSLLSLWMPLAVKECSTFSSTQCARRAVAPRCSGGQLITQVWDLVTGHHHPALCCCQEPFTPSSSLPNGTSESIKTIITANPTQSREIIFACRSKHGRGVWVCLSVRGSAWYALSRTSHYNLDPLYLSCVNEWLIAAWFFTSLSQLLTTFFFGGGGLVGNRNLWLPVLDGVQTLINRYVFPPTTA